MKPLEEIMVSFYESKFSKTPSVTSLYQVLAEIINGKYANEVNTIRRYFQEGDQEAAQKLKGKLKCFTASGVFKGAHAIRNLETHSQVILIDFDHVKELDKLADCCRKDPHTLFAFRSPTDGYKVAAYVENINENHRHAYKMVSEYYQQLTGIACDIACKDESRLCYVSYDPQAYIATLYTPFVWKKKEEKTDTNNFRTQTETNPEEMPEGTVKEFIKSYFFINPPIKGNRNNTIFRLACKAAKRGYDQKELQSELGTLFYNSTISKSEINSALKSGYKRVYEDKNFNFGQEEKEFYKNKVPKIPSDASSGEEEEEDAYWEGEELRRKTPRFPEDVYNKIPNTVKECLIEDLTPREQDLLLLSILTAYSSVLPGTWGKYNGKCFTPNLFTMGIAPAGSGKSVAQLAGALLNQVNTGIILKSEQAQKVYERQKMEWAQNFKNRKKKEEESMDSEPQQPPFKMLLIPASTSAIRMQIHLRDNGDMGAFILDTEAQTLANANRMDCGHFDDMLCKAFEHEMIASSFKANGIKPIIIHRPRLSLLLTGTPEQLYRLIETPENGLFSRILLYTFREEPIWRDIDPNILGREEMYETLAFQTQQLYEFCKVNPANFHFRRTQWNTLNKEFSELLSNVMIERNDHLQAVIKRHAFMVMRLAMIMTRLRQFEKNHMTRDIYCEEEDFEVALAIVKCCYEHSRLIISSMSNGKYHTLKDPNLKRAFFNALPDSFTTEEAVELAKNYSLSKRSVMRLLAQLNCNKINRIAHGKYEKIILRGI